MSELAHDGRAALDAISASPAPQLSMQRERVSRTGAVLRFAGSALLVTSASTFLLQHWQQAGSVLRYACLLAHTLLLATCGYVCGLHVRESRAARSFFALVLVSVPVHFAALGGMLHSLVALDGTRGPIELWPQSDPLLASATALLGIAVVAVLTRLVAQLLVRPIASRYATTTLVLNAGLLLPLRQPLFAVAMTTVMLCWLFQRDRRIAAEAHFARAEPAVLARTLLLAPIAIVMLRTALWYQPSQAVLGVFCIAVGVMVFAWIPLAWPKLLPLQPLAAGTAVVGCLWLSAALTQTWQVPDALALPALALPALLLIGTLSWFARHARMAYLRTSLVGSAFVIALNALAFLDFAHPNAAAWLALTFGIAVVGMAVYVGQRTAFSAGLLAAGLGLAQISAQLVNFGAFQHWTLLSALGMALILCAAWIERYADSVVRWTRLLRARLAHW